MNEEALFQVHVSSQNASFPVAEIVKVYGHESDKVPAASASLVIVSFYVYSFKIKCAII